MHIVDYDDIRNGNIRKTLWLSFLLSQVLKIILWIGESRPPACDQQAYCALFGTQDSLKHVKHNKMCYSS